MSVRPTRGLAEYQALTLTLADLDHPTPCQLDPERWYSDERAERLAAADACWDCPVIQACGTYADAADERFGCWGGRDRTVSAARRDAA